ncbi:MAG: hypothetical protein U1F53_13855 [Burkholderiaceae bacterium]
MSRPAPTPPGRRRHALIGVAVLCLAGLGLALFARWQPAATPAAAALAATAPPASAPAAPPPPLLDAGQWDRLTASLADQPDRDQHTARIVEFLGFQRGVRTLQAQRQAGQMDAALARRLDAGLPARVARGELSGPEAVRLKAALLEALEPDPARRAAALADWRAELARANPPVTDPRDAQLMQAQQAIVAHWRATAAPGTPPDALLAELDAARQRIYDDKPPTGETR